MNVHILDSAGDKLDVTAPDKANEVLFTTTSKWSGKTTIVEANRDDVELIIHCLSEWLRMQPVGGFKDTD